MSLIVKKDVTVILKGAAAKLGLPPSASSAPHCCRPHTYKTQQTMCSAGILGAQQTRETQDIIAKEWAAGSSAADGYVRDTAMGYDNLRTLSLGITGHLLGDIGRSASTASVELGHLQREREKVEGE